MQYGSAFAFLLKCKYFVFLISDQTTIDIFNHFSNHRMQNVSPHSPLSLSFRFEDANRTFSTDICQCRESHAIRTRNQILAQVHMIPMLLYLHCANRPRNDLLIHFTIQLKSRGNVEGRVMHQTNNPQDYM
jgi:hypothetical protein